MGVMQEDLLAFFTKEAIKIKTNHWLAIFSSMSFNMAALEKKVYCQTCEICLVAQPISTDANTKDILYGTLCKIFAKTKS